MSFVSMMKTGALPEKPWRADAVLRLIASVFICVIMGALAANVFRYFGEPQRKSLGMFVGGSVSGLGCFGGALLVLGRTWQFEKYLRNLLILLLCVYGGFFLMWWTNRFVGDSSEEQNSTVRMLVAVLSFQGAALVLVHFFLREHHTNWADGFGLNNRIGHALLLGVIVGLLLLPIVWGLQSVSILLLQSLTLHPHEQETVELLRATDTWPSRFILGIATIALAPAAEEVIFRGILYPAIKRAGYPRLALWGTALFFGLIHANLQTFLPLTFLAIMLVWIYEYTGNLLACFTVHCLFNAVNFVALYLFQK
jgi:membrane protease YdiL (CAAX protease family)